MTVRFTLSGQDEEARVGVLETPHGPVQTPAFMPVGTQGTVKAVPPWDLQRLGASMVLGNAYHLYLRPGHEAVARLGGLHRFVGYDGPMLTDSGGFQVFSLAHIRQISDDGVVFRSHLDGSEHSLSPEKVMEVEEALGADVAMVLDEPVPYPTSVGDTEAATRRTHAWAERCRWAHTRPDQALFAIVQGGLDEGLRRWSAQTLTEMDFPGYAIGGLSLGEPKEETWRMVVTVTAELPGDKARYLMGVGSPDDLLQGIAQGVDLFDSSFPTRIARNGAFLTYEGRVNIKNARFEGEARPVLEGCDCPACERFSAAYMHHLFKAEELLGYHLASLHNLRFMLRLAEEARTAIASGRFRAFATEFLERFKAPDPEVRAEQKARWLAARERRGLPAAVRHAPT